MITKKRHKRKKWASSEEAGRLLWVGLGAVVAPGPLRRQLGDSGTSWVCCGGGHLWRGQQAWSSLYLLQGHWPAGDPDPLTCLAPCHLARDLKDTGTRRTWGQHGWRPFLQGLALGPWASLGPSGSPGLGLSPGVWLQLEADLPDRPLSSTVLVNVAERDAALA